MRKNRSDSVTAAVAAAQRKRPSVPEHVVLHDEARPFWDAIISCRDDWQAHELPTAVALAEAWSTIEILGREIDAEGTIVKGKINVKCRLVETLHKRATSLARHLQLHARATRGEARDVARKKPAASLDKQDDPHGLLA